MNAITKPEGLQRGMGGLGESVFGAVAERMNALGWSIFPQERDGDVRRPCRVEGETIAPKNGYHLHEREVAPEVLRKWSLHCARANVAMMFGPRMPGLFALDVDVYDVEKSRRVGELALEHLGPTGFRRVGRAPKFAVLYRMSGGQAVRGRTIRLADEKGEDSGHAIEILSDGKTLTVHGYHHLTGDYFKWSSLGDCKSRHLGIDRPEDAPEVDASQLEVFLAAIEAEFPAVRQSYVSDENWSEVDAGRVRVSRIARDPDAPLATDGREEIRRDMAWRTSQANARAIILAPDADLPGLLRDIAAAVVEEFGTVAVMDSKWATAAVRSRTLADLERLAGKLRSGEVRPPRGQGIVPGVDGGAPRVRPVIKLETGDIAATVDAAEKALGESDRAVYQRGDAIVHLGWLNVATAYGFEVAAQRIFAVNEAALLEHISESAEFQQFKKSKKDEGDGAWVKCTPPAWVAKHLASRTGRKKLPVLAGVIGAPTLRADGTIVEAEGYDPKTGLLLDFVGATYPVVPQKPTKQEASEALAVLDGLLSAYPFATPAARSVALACWLTAVIRKSLRTSPLFLFSAPVRGSGKSKLADVASVLVTGREAGVINLAEDDDPAEDQKRVASELMKGTTVLVVDNVERPITGQLMQSMATQVTVSLRILGKSESVELSTNTLFIGTGNNISVAADMTRRCLLSVIDPGVDRPEHREFDFDPVEVAKKKRGDLVAAALTVLRAYHVAGRPSQSLKPLGNFEQWSDWVRGALVWLGQADPCITQDRLEDLDPRKEELSGILGQWKHDLGCRRLSVSDIIAFACEQQPDGQGRPVFKRPHFRDAFMAVANQGGAVNARRVAAYFRRNEGRIVGGCKLVQDAKGHGGSITWRLEMDEATLAAMEDARLAALPDQDESAAKTQVRIAKLSESARELVSTDRVLAWMNSSLEWLGGVTPSAACATEEGYLLAVTGLKDLAASRGKLPLTHEATG